MTYLLDTNVCIEFMRRRNANIVHQIQSRSSSEIVLCATVVSELCYGTFKGKNPTTNLPILEKFLSEFVTLPFDAAAAQIAGRLRANLGGTGRKIGPNDLQIASVALLHQLTVVTHNVSEFTRVPGLTVEDWQT